MDTTTHGTLRAANAARQQEWDTEGQITMAYRGNELAGEVGEACNVIKKLERERMGIRGSRATVEQLAEELADIISQNDFDALCTLALSSIAMREALEKAERWHDRQAEQAMNSLSCGSENWEYRQAHAEADEHRAMARDLRRAAEAYQEQGK